MSSHGHLKTRAASSPSSHRANRSVFRSERSRINDSIIPLKKSIFSILYSMKYQRYSLVAALALLAAPCQKATADQFRSGLSWSTVVNNLDDIPGTTTKFNSYNQPSINSQGYLVFRARGKGTEGPLSGIFTRDLSAETPVTVTIADRNTQVPSPSNTTYPPDDVLSMFTEFPSIPRISANQRTIATRGNHKPVWTYLVGETESRAGTTGIFVNPGGVLSTGVSILGAVPEPSGGVIGVDYFPYFAVPDAPAGTKFDVFPGSPSITDFDVIAFKGNYTDVTPKTGVFYRDLVAENGLASVQLIANSNTEIPGFPGFLFGSTAPPSAHGSEVVFVGLDNEEAPSKGGIYWAPLSTNPALTTLVEIGDAVPGVENESFNKFGEALAFDGRYVGFWAAWGEETRDLLLLCPEDGNKDLIAYCMETYPDGFATTIPVNQGVFVHDTYSGETKMIARTGDRYSDFVYWVFSGRPPGTGESDESDGELPRWRSSAFVAASAGIDGMPLVAFKARFAGETPGDGIYLGNDTEVVTLVDTTTSGSVVDPLAPEGAVITTLAIERESFRGRWLAISAGMEVPAPVGAAEPAETEGLAGVYALKLSIQPDSQIGRSITQVLGNNVYQTPSGQTLRQTSHEAQTVHAVAKIENDGDVPDRFLLRGSKGNSFFDVFYKSPTGNVTAAVKAGLFTTGIVLPDEQSPGLTVEVKPNRALIESNRSNKKAHKLIVKMQSYSEVDPTSSDLNHLDLKAKIKRSAGNNDAGGGNPRRSVESYPEDDLGGHRTRR